MPPEGYNLCVGCGDFKEIKPNTLCEECKKEYLILEKKGRLCLPIFKRS